MVESISLEQILFLDIETVPQQSDFDELEKPWQDLWEKKLNTLRFKDNEEESPYDRAGIYAEFGKIVCISVGFCFGNGDEPKMRIKSFYGDDEKELLIAFNNMLNEHFYRRYHFLCAHNGQEFDFPYICRRSLLNGLALPKGLQIMGNKPWENKHLIDTMRLWAFGDFKNYTSITLLALAFGIPSPKDDISGADVRRVYYEEQDLSRIVEYCQKDVITLTNLFCAMTGKPVIEPTSIEILE